MNTVSLNAVIDTFVSLCEHDKKTMIEVTWLRMYDAGGWTTATAPSLPGER